MKPNISEEDILRALEGKPMRPMEIVHALGLPRTCPGERHTMLTVEIVSGHLARLKKKGIVGRAAARWILSSRAHLRVDIPKEREAELRALVGEWGGVVA